MSHTPRHDEDRGSDPRQAAYRAYSEATDRTGGFPLSFRDWLAAGQPSPPATTQLSQEFSTFLSGLGFNVGTDLDAPAIAQSLLTEAGIEGNTGINELLDILRGGQTAFEGLEPFGESLRQDVSDTFNIGLSGLRNRTQQDVFTRLTGARETRSVSGFGGRINTARVTRPTGRAFGIGLSTLRTGREGNLRSAQRAIDTEEARVTEGLGIQDFLDQLIGLGA